MTETRDGNHPMRKRLGGEPMRSGDVDDFLISDVAVNVTRARQLGLTLLEQRRGPV
jgi:hypothetical protein